MLVNMNDVLLPASKNKYGVGFFNAVNIEMAKAVIEGAQELRAPVMIGTAEVLLKFMGLEDVASYLLPMAKRSAFPVAVHMDHALTYDVCIKATELGFPSVMYDCSTMKYEENVRNMAEMVRYCHLKGVTVEGELGHVGDNFGDGKLANPSDYFTDSELACDFVSRTGVDALAVAVGNAHGDYTFPPKLDFERISTIFQKTGKPLVLHGGSGLSDSDFENAIQRGICKINIFTDIDKAGKAGYEKGISEGCKTATSLMEYAIDSMKSVVKEKIKLFGSAGKA